MSLQILYVGGYNGSMAVKRRILRWLWNGTVIVSLVMMAGIAVLVIASYAGRHVVTRIQWFELTAGQSDAAVTYIRRDLIKFRAGQVHYSHQIKPYGSAQLFFPTVWEYTEHASMFLQAPGKPYFAFAGIALHHDVQPVSSVDSTTNGRPMTITVPGGEQVYRLIRLPLWYPLALATILPILWLILWYRRRHKRLPGYCSACGYDLTGTLAASRTECPECGASIEEEANDDMKRKRSILQWLWNGAVIVSLVMMVGVGVTLRPQRQEDHCGVMTLGSSRQ